MHKHMHEKLEIFLKLVKELMNKQFTGQLRLNLHQGDLSEKVEIKESVKLEYEESVEDCGGEFQ